VYYSTTEPVLLELKSLNRCTREAVPVNCDGMFGRAKQPLTFTRGIGYREEIKGNLIEYRIVEFAFLDLLIKGVIY